MRRPGLNYRLGRLPLFPLRVLYLGLSTRPKKLEERNKKPSTEAGQVNAHIEDNGAVAAK